MLATDFYAGPILRRVQQDMVVVWFATTTSLKFEVTVRKAADRSWYPTVCERVSIPVFPKLWVHLGIVTFAGNGTFPASTLLEYSIAELNADGDLDHASFETIVKDDMLSYPGYALPTFFIQARSQPLNALYGSCRKPHDIKGGDDDAMAYGDDVILKAPADLNTRPTILCLGGDQIYADDVCDAVFDQLATVATGLEAPIEPLPAGLTLPGKGNRQHFLEKEAAFTSGFAANHLVTFAEYVAMYGLVWNRRNWPSSVTPAEVKTFVDVLPKVRRLMANTPTYMIFDDHDVTDDWNLSVRWAMEVHARYLGRRIVANALFAYWLFQAWGNDPDLYRPRVVKMIEMADQRTEQPEQLDSFFWDYHDWEFFTPTYPFIYALDTRTQRGTNTGLNTGSTGPPAYLKDVPAWKETVRRLNKLLSKQGRGSPLVLLAPAPVFGYEKVDAGQAAVTAVAGPYFVDFEGWAANSRHLSLFARLCSDLDVVLLSGDVHYSHTDTVRFDSFDDDWMRDVRTAFPTITFPKTGAGSSPTYAFLYSARFLQLTSSGTRNFAQSVVQAAAGIDKTVGWYVDQNGTKCCGHYKNGEFFVQEWHYYVPTTLVLIESKRKLEEAKPRCAFVLRYNDSYNSAYLPDHNLGLVTITGRTVSNVFLTRNGRVNAKSWDFNNDAPWATP